MNFCHAENLGANILSFMIWKLENRARIVALKSPGTPIVGIIVLSSLEAFWEGFGNA